MAYDFMEAGDRLEAKLAQIKGKETLPVELLEMLAEVARLQLAARSVAELPSPAETAFSSQDDMLRGKPLLDKKNFPMDLPQALMLFGKLMELSLCAGEALEQATLTIKSDITSGKLAPEDIFTRILESDDAFFQAWAERTPQAPKTIYFLGYSSLFPSISSAAELLAPRLPAIETWTRAACPICGSLPLISVLRGKEGARHAVCSFCRHEYRVRRISCLACDEDDQKKLTFFTAKEEPGFRVDVCSTCKHYVKTIDFRELDKIVLAEFDDLDSLALDYLAVDQGFSRPTLSAWGF